MNCFVMGRKKLSGYTNTRRRENVFIVTVLLAALVYAITGCGSGGSGYSGSVVTTKSGGGYLTFYLDVDQASSRKDVGESYASAILSVFPDFEKQIDSLLNAMFVKLQERDSAVNFSGLLVEAEAIRQNIPAEYSEEISGMQEIFSYSVDQLGDGRLSRNELLVYQLSMDIFGPPAGSAVGVWGGGTTSGDTLVGVNVDWPDNITLDNPKMMSTVIFIDGDRSIASIGFTGLLATGCAFSDDHIFGCILGADISDSNPLTAIMGSSAMDLRYALETENSRQKVTDFLSSIDYRYDHQVFVADISAAQVLENDIDGLDRGLRHSLSSLSTGISWSNPNAIAAVNAFLLNGNESSFSSLTNSARWDSYCRYLDSAPHTTTWNSTDIKQIQDFKGDSNSEAADDGALFRSHDGYSTCQRIILDINLMEMSVFFPSSDPQDGSPLQVEYFDGDIFTIPTPPPTAEQHCCELVARNTNLEIDVDITCSLNNQTYLLKAGARERWYIEEGCDNLSNKFSISKVHTSRSKIIPVLRVVRINQSQGVHWYEITAGVFREWTFINTGTTYPMHGDIYRPSPWERENTVLAVGETKKVVGDAISLLPNGPYEVNDWEQREHDPAYQYWYNIEGDLGNAEIRLARLAKARAITDVDFELFGWYYGYLTYWIHDRQTNESAIWAVFALTGYSRTIKMPLGHHGFDAKWYSWRDEEWYPVSRIEGDRTNGFKVRAVVTN